MDFEEHMGENHSKEPVNEPVIWLKPLGGSRSPRRMLYSAEIKVFKDQHGGLEDIRRNLGVSRRKMCELLLVDPSAWTRWAKDEDRVPPHVYRALEWFLALNHKTKTHPELADVFSARYKHIGRDVNQAEVVAKLGSLQEEIRKQRRWMGAMAAGILGLALWLFLH